MTGRPILEIDLAAIRANYRYLQALAPAGSVAGVVKANGYGLGARQVTAALRSAGCRLFFVARALEGVELRRHFPDIEIAVLDGIAPDTATTLADAKLIPVLNQVVEFEEWMAVAKRAAVPLPAMLHVETGINRLGFERRDLPSSEELGARGVQLRAVLGHLACADDPASVMNADQLACFQSLLVRYPNVPASLANSSGMFLGANYHFDFCRPGAAVCGVNPTPGLRNPMRPVVRLTAPVLQLRELDAAGTVGYGATFKGKRGTVLATIAIGYADGLVRAAGNRGEAAIAGRKVPYAGRISMDIVSLDVSAIPKNLLARGLEVEVLGETVGVDDLAKAAGTIGYEILTSLSNRYERRYKGERCICEREPA